VVVDEEAAEVAGEVVEETFDASEMTETGEFDEIDDDSEALMGMVSS
jgi:hypothetical protein